MFWLLLPKLLASLALIVLISVLYAGFDALTISVRNLTNTTRNLNHRSRHVLRLLSCVLLAYCTFGISWLALAHALVLASVFFLVFDPVLNKNRGKEWDYVGESNAWDLRWTLRYGARAGRVMFRFELVGLVATLALFTTLAILLP